MDWGSTITPSGLWKDVTLEGWTAAQLKDIYFKQTALSDTLALVDAQLEIEVLQSGEYQIDLNDSTYSFLLNAGHQSITIPIPVKDPQLWWPIGYGEQYLYSFECTLKKDNTPLAKHTSKLGLRKVELITDKSQEGSEFYFKINDTPIFMKGANYIPQDHLQDRVGDSHYRQLLTHAVGANMNMLRVWGGGIYEEDIFYNLCDSLGILVWQDFMFACAMYPSDSSFLHSVHHEAIDNVKRLRKHPSIVLWCGNNENAEGWQRWGWQDAFDDQQKQEIEQGYKSIFNGILPNIVKEYTSLPYWESSPKLGRGDPQHQFEGDAHYWGVWHDAEPFDVLEEKVPRFMSEFGFQSFPSQQVLDYVMQGKLLDLNNGAIKSHQKHHRGFQLINEYVARDFQVPTDPQDYAYVSQLVQAKGMRMGIEAHRRAKPYNMGTLYWQLNDCWPAISWSSIDYFGQWKALHHAAKEAFENVLISFEQVDELLKVYVVNDHLQAFNETLHLTIQDFSGNIIWEIDKTVTVSPSSSQVVYTLPMKELDINATNNFLQASMGAASSLYYFERPKNLALAQSDIEMKVSKHADGFAIVLKSATLQKAVQLSASSVGTFDDNYFDLLPNQDKQLYFSTREKDVTFQFRSLNLLL